MWAEKIIFKNVCVYVLYEIVISEKRYHEFEEE